MTLRLPTWAHQDQEDREDSSASYPRFKSRVSLKTSGVYIYNISYLQVPIWLVVSTPLKNISQLLLFPIYGKMFQTANQL